MPIIRKAIYEIIESLLDIGNINNPKEEFDQDNLINYYLVILVKVLIQCDLFKILLELSGNEDRQISE